MNLTMTFLSISMEAEKPVKALSKNYWLIIHKNTRTPYQGVGFRYNCLEKKLLKLSNKATVKLYTMSIIKKRKILKI